MLIHCPARLSAIAARAAAPAAALSGLGGCATAGGAPASQLVVAVAVVLVAALAGVLGAWIMHVRQRSALRAAREALRTAHLLDDGWVWQTDAQLRLQRWSASGQGASEGCLFFEPHVQPELLARLAQQQPFAGLRLAAPAALHGSRGWRLSGMPRTGDDGAFAGFEGRAWPTDADDLRTLAAAALPAALGACGEPALLACESGDGWRVCELNAAARQAWPAAACGQPVAELLAAWPDVLAALQTSKAQAQQQELQGWRLLFVAPGAAMAALPRAAVLKQMQPPGSTGAVAPDGEGDTFSFTLSHDLRAPIRVVEGFTRIVKEDYGRQLDRVGNDHLERVLGAAARMNLMIDALLTLARLSQQPLARQRVNLSQLAGYVVDDLRRSAPERNADIDIEPQLTAWGDPTLLRLVLENLLGNAWKYTGRCTQAQIALRTTTQGGRHALVVRDNGAGFDMRSADRLFGLFQRLHSASDFPGHGVGLASVRRIVRRHGGEIWAESEPGRGAAFYFTLAP